MSSKSLAAWFGPPSKTLTAPALVFWVGGRVLVRKVSDGVKDEGLGPWGIR
jgi:hypothetical protein